MNNQKRKVRDSSFWRCLHCLLIIPPGIYNYMNFASLNFEKDFDGPEKSIFCE